MAILHLMVGLPCSGKTTKARILEKEYNALLLTTDKWHIKLYGNRTHLKDHKEHDKMHDKVEKMLWEIGKRVLALGIDVILDFGFWGKEERDWFRSEAKRLNVGFKIHYMNVDEKELFSRLNKRNEELSDDVFYIPAENMEKYIKLFQPVEQEELVENVENNTF